MSVKRVSLLSGAVLSPEVIGTPSQQRAALIVWMDGLSSSGKVGYLRGNYTISAEIDRSDDNLTIIGAGPGRSSITLDSTVSQNQRILQFTGSDDLLVGFQARPQQYG
jgi:hypothetical protein